MDRGFRFQEALAVASSGYSVKSQTTLGRVSALWSRGRRLSPPLRALRSCGGPVGSESAGGSARRARGVPEAPPGGGRLTLPLCFVLQRAAGPARRRRGCERREAARQAASRREVRASGGGSPWFSPEGRSRALRSPAPTPDPQPRATRGYRPTCSDPEPGSRAEPFLLKGPFKGPFARVPPPTACSGRVNGPEEVLRKGFTFLFNSQRHGTPRNPRFREKQAGIPGLELFPSGISFSSPELAVEWT